MHHSVFFQNQAPSLLNFFHAQLSMKFFLLINCWHFNIYEQENGILDLSEPKKADFLDIFILTSI